MSTDARIQQERAVAIAAEAIGEVMRFWNFKPSMGRIWTVLYLTPDPLDAQEIERYTGLSSGNVSVTVQELLQWGVIRRAPHMERRRMYVAETDIWALVAHVFEQREVRVIDTTIAHLEEAIRIIEEQGKSSQPVAMLHGRFLLTRLGNLLGLAKTGRAIVARLAQSGRVDLGPLRNLLRSRVS